jgi:hypothetical protein
VQDRIELGSFSSTPVPTKPRSQTAGNATPKAPTLTVANGTAQASAICTPPRTKPRSNTVNDYSPVKSSPLSQNVITASSGRPDSSSSWKRRSVQVVVSTHTKVATTPRGARTSDPDKIVPAALQYRPGLLKGGHLTKRQRVKNGECEPTMTPTAAFMKPVNKSAKSCETDDEFYQALDSDLDCWRRRLHTQCSNMFRNSLSMIVR